MPENYIPDYLQAIRTERLKDFTPHSFDWAKSDYIKNLRRSHPDLYNYKLKGPNWLDLLGQNYINTVWNNESNVKAISRNIISNTINGNNAHSNDTFDMYSKIYHYGTGDISESAITSYGDNLFKSFLPELGNYIHTPSGTFYEDVDKDNYDFYSKNLSTYGKGLYKQALQTYDPTLLPEITVTDKQGGILNYLNYIK